MGCGVHEHSFAVRCVGFATGASGLRVHVLLAAAKPVSGFGGGSPGDRQRPAGHAVPGFHAAVWTFRRPKLHQVAGRAGLEVRLPAPAHSSLQQTLFLPESTGFSSLSFHLRSPRDTLVISADVATCRCYFTGLLATIIFIDQGASFLDRVPELTSVSVWLKKSVAESLECGRG